MRRLLTLSRHFIKPAQGDEQPPKRILVTGAAGNIGYILNFMIAQGRMLGPKQPVILHLFEIPPAEGALKGVVMELNDGAFPLVKDIVATIDPVVAFKDVDIAVLVGARPRSKGMLRKDLLAANGAIFKEQGNYLEKYAKKDVKVLVVGNPANTNAFIASRYAPSIPDENFTALTRLDQNRAISQIAQRTGATLEDIKNIIIWGNHSATQYPDLNHAYVLGKDNQQQPIRSLVNDDEWIQKAFISKVQKRGAEIIAARGLSSAASAANAACDHMHDWVLGTLPNEVVSMAVVSDGSYGVPRGLIYSFPVTCKDGKYEIVQGYKVNEFSQQKMDATTKELIEERDAALGSLETPDVRRR